MAVLKPHEGSRKRERGKKKKENSERLIFIFNLGH